MCVIKVYGLFNDANWYFTSATYGNGISLVKTFTDTYLNIDGSRFTRHALVMITCLSMKK